MNVTDPFCALTSGANDAEWLPVLLDAMEEMVFVVEPGGSIVHLNQAAASVLGYAGTELIGHPVPTTLPEDWARIAKAQRAGRPVALRKAKGEEVMADVRVVAGEWHARPVWVVICADLSARLAAEERRRLGDCVFDNIREGVMITDAKGVVVDVNATFTEVTGFNRDEVIGRSAELFRSDRHDEDFFRQMWDSVRTRGFWQGEVWKRRKDGESFVELLIISAVRASDGAVTHYVGIFSDVTQQKEHQRRLEQMAHFDALTQLPNRKLLADRMQVALAQAARSKRLLGVCYLDLDGFKPINDQLGHAAGDRLLIEVAQRLRLCLRAGDTVARLGGDEFVILLCGLEDQQECDRALNRIIGSLAQAFFIAGQEVSVSASIGVTLYPHDSSDADTLLRHADQAMYAAKQAGRNRYHLFDPENDRRAKRRHDELGRIRKGLARREFVLHYQPKVDMRQGKVLGMEALIRWHDPERGLLPPFEFLPLVEGSELAIELGDWVLSEAVQQLERWQRAGLDVSVSVNISGEHLQSTGFAKRMSDLLARFPDLPPQRLELEVVETVALDDIVKVSEVFQDCQKLGVVFALDDFGTGYSSLTYFRRLPAEVLKIDQSFVRDMIDDPEDMAIVEGVIGLTQAFNRRVVAEGVETPEHGMLLLQLGCDLGQGYGIARPMPAEAVPAWVAGFQPDSQWSASASFQWSRDDLPLLVAEIDHVRWKKNLIAYLMDKAGEAPAVSDPRRCRFGHWYHGEARQRYSQLDTFDALARVHQRIHEVGNALLLKHGRGEKAGLAQGIAELEELSNRLSEYIQVIQAEVLLARSDQQPLAF